MNIALVLFGNISLFKIWHYVDNMSNCKMYTTQIFQYLLVILVNSFLSFIVLHLTAKSSVSIQNQLSAAPQSRNKAVFVTFD